MENYEEKCRLLLNAGRSQAGQFSDKTTRLMSFYRRMYHYYKKYFTTLYSQAIMDQQQIIKELKEVNDSLILEKKHNQRLKNEIELLKKSK